MIRLPVRSWRTWAFTRHLSTTSSLKLLSEHTGISVGQGGQLTVRLEGCVASVEISTAWADFCDLSVFRLGGASCEGPPSSTSIVDDEYRNPSQGGDIAVDVDEVAGKVTVADGAGGNPTSTVADARSQRRYLVRAVVPEMFSVDARVGKGSFRVSNKLKGQCLVSLSGGDVEVGTVRGERIILSTGKGRVVAKELEGSVNIEATQVEAALINGASVRIHATGTGASVDIGGVYSPDTKIGTEGMLAVSSSHGHISVEGDSQDLTLWGVNGSADVLTGRGNVTLHLETLEAGSSTQVRSSAGDISASVSNEVQAAVEISGNIGDLSPTFIGQVQGNKAFGEMVGSLSAGMHVREGSSLGKIDLQGARDQSLRNFTVKDIEDHSRSNTKVKLSTEKGKVKLETLGWMDLIRRKCGKTE